MFLYINQANPSAIPAALSKPLLKAPASCPPLAPLVVTVEEEARAAEVAAVPVDLLEEPPVAVALVPPPVADALPVAPALPVAVAPAAPVVPLALAFRATAPSAPTAL